MVNVDVPVPVIIAGTSLRIGVKSGRVAGGWLVVELLLEDELLLEEELDDVLLLEEPEVLDVGLMEELLSPTSVEEVDEAGEVEVVPAVELLLVADGAGVLLELVTGAAGGQ